MATMRQIACPTRLHRITLEVTKFLTKTATGYKRVQLLNTEIITLFIARFDHDPSQNIYDRLHHSYDQSSGPILSSDKE